MSAQTIDWQGRYASGDTPWDSDTPSAELLRVLAEQRVAPGAALEVGCGTGTNAVELARRGFVVTGFDLAPLAIEKAHRRAAAAGVSPRLFAADLDDVCDRHGLRGPFAFVFDRGVYHSVRPEGLGAYLRTLVKVTSPGALLLVLAGNKNDSTPEDRGPPRVHAHEIAIELGGVFDLLMLREFVFDGVVIDGEAVKPLGWSALLRRKTLRC